jgi:hypothetical protein
MQMIRQEGLTDKSSRTDKERHKSIKKIEHNGPSLGCQFNQCGQENTSVLLGDSSTPQASCKLAEVGGYCIG